MTADAANKSLTEAEAAKLVLGATLDSLGKNWNRQEIEANLKAIGAHLTNIIVAQEFQDLAGQSLRKATKALVGAIIVVEGGGPTEEGRLSQSEIDGLLGRLHVFTQDALAPMRMANGLSFVRDFERLLGPRFFAKIKSFTPMITETDDLEGELRKYLERLDSLGGIDLFFLGLGPEAEAASHLCYIKPGCGAEFGDFAGIIPISPSILEHHIAKFKVGGSEVSAEDEDECRRAAYILTLGPAAILGARRIIQSIVDASTATAKPASFKRLIETVLSSDDAELARQADENPGLLIRLHPDVRSYILPDLLS
jgi:hypothetical protein